MKNPENLSGRFLSLTLIFALSLCSFARIPTNFISILYQYYQMGKLYNSNFKLPKRPGYVHLIFAHPLKIYFTVSDLFLQAEKCQPNFLSRNHLMIAKCYLQLDSKDIAEIYLKNIVNWRNTIERDEFSYQEALAIIKSHYP